MPPIIACASCWFFLLPIVFPSFSREDIEHVWFITFIFNTNSLTYTPNIIHRHSRVVVQENPIFPIFINIKWQQVEFAAFPTSSTFYITLTMEDLCFTECFLIAFNTAFLSLQGILATLVMWLGMFVCWNSWNVKCDVWIKLWFVGEFCEKWVINHEMMFWWIEIYYYVEEVVNEE